MAKEKVTNGGDIDALVLLAQQGSEAALSEIIVTVSPLVHSKAKRFSGSGVELEDLCQEGMLGVLSAVNTYSSDGAASFRTYVGVCVNNRLTSVVRRESGKSVFAGEALPLDGEDCPSGEQSVEEQLINKIMCDNVVEYVNSRLSKKEREALRLFLSGLSYEEISRRTGSSAKSVDNALQRVRQKLKKFNS